MPPTVTPTDIVRDLAVGYHLALDDAQIERLLWELTCYPFAGWRTQADEVLADLPEVRVP